MKTFMQDEETKARDRAIRRCVKLQAAMELLGGMIAFGIILLVAWLFCVATPAQSSAENDLTPEVVR